MAPKFLKKKRFLIPAGIVVAFGGLVIWADGTVKQLTKDCNAGVAEACKEIVVEHDYLLKDITTSEGKKAVQAAIAQDKAEKEAQEAKELAEKKAKAAKEAEALAAEVARRRAIARQNGHDVTLANFNSLRSGMSYQQVVNILGKPGTLVSESNLAGYNTVMYCWQSPRGATGANMNAMFQNGRLVQKAQFGLR